MHGFAFFPRRFLDSKWSRPVSSRTTRTATLAGQGGFAKKTEQKPATGGKGKKGPKQKKRKLKPPSNPMAPAQPSPNSRDEAFAQRWEEKTEASLEDNLAFEKRLKALKKQGKATQTERVSFNPSEGGILTSSSVSPLESPPKQRPKMQNDEEATPVGIPQVAVGTLSLFLVAVFFFTSGFGPGGGPTPQPQEGLTAEQLKDLRDRSKELDKKLQSTPDDVESLKELSDLSTVLGDLKKASSLAERTTKAAPSDSKAWLALADARGRLSDFRGAVTAYEKAIKASEAPTLPQLQGLAAALVSDNRASEAIQQLQGFESRAGMNGAVGEVELQMLIGKVYSQWDRHFASALAVYDGIIQKFPNDFRGYLARGALLKEYGRKGDAQRMFIQARFLAPTEARAVVDDVANR